MAAPSETPPPRRALIAAGFRIFAPVLAPVLAVALASGSLAAYSGGARPKGRRKRRS